MKVKYQCVRHRRYVTKEDADEALVKSNKKYNINLIRAYECAWCPWVASNQ